MVTLLILPVMVLLFINAREFILLLIGEKWEAVIPFLQLFCIAGFFYLMIAGKFSLINALGFPKYVTRFNGFEVITKPALIIGIAALTDAGMDIIAIIFSAYFLFRFIYASWHLSRKLNVSFFKIGFSNYRELLIIIFSGIAGYLSVKFIAIDAHLVAFSIKVFVFAIIYTILVFFFAKEIFLESKNTFFGKF